MGPPSDRQGSARTRIARRDDARTIAEFYLSASDGAAERVWSRHVRGDASVLDVGEQVFARTDGRLTCDHSIVVEDGEIIVGVMVAFPNDAEGASRRVDQLDRIPVDFPEWPAERMLHIAALVLRPDYRGQGLGEKLLNLAETEAATTGLAATTVIVPAHNEPGCQYLRDHGYMEFDRQDLPDQPRAGQSAQAILFAKYVG